jgi:poly(3-hydroxybutyrate) depolymerase
MRVAVTDPVKATLRGVRLAMVAVVAFAAGLSAAPSSPPSSPSSPTTAPELVEAGAAVTVTWSTKKRTLSDGRTFFVRVPACSPYRSPGCREFRGRERALVIFLHGADGAEDAETAAGWLGGLHALSRDTIFAFGVSKNGTRRWDAGFCCTANPVDDVGYLARVVNKVAGKWSVDRKRVGAIGLSNGGMLALRAICELPDKFAAATALAATYDQGCDLGRVRVGQWHGGRDATVPLNGGTVTVDDEQRTLPPVASLAQRMASGSVYELHVLPNRAHAMAWPQFRQATRWLVAHLPD